MRPIVAQTLKQRWLKQQMQTNIKIVQKTIKQNLATSTPKLKLKKKQIKFQLTTTTSIQPITLQLVLNNNKLRYMILPCFPENKTGLILIFTPKYGTRAYFRGMYYFEMSKNEVTK